MTVRRILLLGVAAAALLTLGVWLGGIRLADQPLLPDRGASWYVWKLPEPTVWTRLSAWAGYIAHQLVSWGLIFYAQTRVRTYSRTLHPINVVALLANLGFIVLHQVQSQVFYDGLAQDVSIYSSQGSVIALLVVVLLMENRRRGMAFGRPAPIKAEVIGFARKYHGYLFSWAAIYTFWYHPMLNTSGHLIGFFYMFLLLVQGSLFLTRAHTNRIWTLVLELLVAVHGTLVAIMNSGPNGLWPMFLFGFLAIFVITQMHGVGLSRRTRWVIGIGYVVAVLAVYTWRGLGSIHQITWIPLAEYGLVAVLALVLWGGLAIAKAVRPPSPSGSQEKDPESAGRGAGRT
ncbi:hypothetical protein ACQBAU_07030 [Propionibacteriaceae bacterium Y2011]|uniref:hypothetical protein n=1 Tax=Microlunatus sp. Y2014 TaxID=3418488 RepID=UPI003B460BA7